jgi:hypothetical protein
MTEIDAAADIDTVWRDQELTIRIPLAGEVGREWAQRYTALARRSNVPARAEEAPGRAWIVITLPVETEPSEVLAALDDASKLIAKADAAEQPSAEREKEIAAAVRDWWAKQRD